MNRQQATRRVGLLGLFANLALAVLKLFAGYLCKSSAMIADGFNSAGDVFSSVMTLLGNHIATEPGDEDHPYGHGKAEYIFSAVIGAVLLLVAWNTLTGAVASLSAPSAVDNAAVLLIVAAVTLTVKAALAQYCIRIGKQLKNPLVLANAEDHRSDLFVTLGTVAGIAGNLCGVYWLDGAAGILVSGWIGLQGIRILQSAYIVLMDTTSRQAQPILDQARKIAERTPGVDHVDQVRTRPVGTRFSVVIKISVPGSMTVLESHQITHRIASSLNKNPDVADVVIHVNPLEEHPGPSTD